MPIHLDFFDNYRPDCHTQNSVKTPFDRGHRTVDNNPTVTPAQPLDTEETERDTEDMDENTENSCWVA